MSTTAEQRPTHCQGPCGRSLVSKDHPGRVPHGSARHSGSGLCATCRQRAKRIEQHQPAPAPVPADVTRLALGDPVGRRAVLQVCGRARSAADARVILTRLGLRGVAA